MSQLHLCPDCGSDDVGVVYDGYWNVECGNCGSVGPSASTALGAERKWNLVAERDWDRLKNQREQMAG